MRISYQDLLDAIAVIESGKRGFEDGYPVIRWEGHVFYRNLPKDKRRAGLLSGLASVSAGEAKNPRSQKLRHQMLQRAAKIDENAAYCAISVGKYQVLGENWLFLDYDSPKDIYDTCKTEDGQREVAIRFLEKAVPPYMLEAPIDVKGIARRYNGPGYKRNRYDEKLASALGLSHTPVSIDSALKLGAQGERVRMLQEKLSRIGFRVRVDGDFGPDTDKAVRMVQYHAGIVDDGIAGPETMAAIGRYMCEVVTSEPLAREKETKKTLKKRSRIVSSSSASKKTAGAIATVAAASEVVRQSKAVVSDATGMLSQLSGLWDSYGFAIIILGMAAVWYFASKAQKARIEDEVLGKTY